MTQATLTPADRLALSEVHAVLSRHGLQDRFGVSLNHDHFPLQSGEVMHETNDTSLRTLTVVPKQLSELPSGAFASQWMFAPDGAPIAVQYCCDPPRH
jgi:hypothetical protein